MAPYSRAPNRISLFGIRVGANCLYGSAAAHHRSATRLRYSRYDFRFVRRSDAVVPAGPSARGGMAGGSAAHVLLFESEPGGHLREWTRSIQVTSGPGGPQKRR